MMVSYSLAGEKNLLAPFDTNQLRAWMHLAWMDLAYDIRVHAR